MDAIMHFLIVQHLDLGNLGKRVCFAYPSLPSSGQPFRRNALTHTDIYKLEQKTVLTLHNSENATIHFNQNISHKINIRQSFAYSSKHSPKLPYNLKNV